MQLEPHVVVKRLIDAEPGELVRTYCNDLAALALIANGRGRQIIVLERDPDGMSVPRYFGIDSDDSSIGLSFGKNYVFGFDSSNATVIDPHGRRLLHTNGVMVLVGARSLIRVASSRPDLSPAYYDIATGQFVAFPPTPDQVFLGKWNIKLRREGNRNLVTPTPEKSIFEFNAVP